MQEFVMGTLSIWHWLIVLLVVILVFGTKKLKNIGADLGGAVKGFKDGMKQPGDGTQTDPAQTTTTSAQVGQAPAAADKNTIDVEAKTKL